MTSYWRRLRDIVAERGPLCVGIDPHPSLLAAWGLSADAAGAEACARALVEALGDKVAAFKPQSAFFEAYGSAGIAALERVLADISDTGALSILDVKRGDIGSTMDAYAEAYLCDGAPLAPDAITLLTWIGACAVILFLLPKPSPGTYRMLQGGAFYAGAFGFIARRRLGPPPRGLI